MKDGWSVILAPLLELLRWQRDLWLRRRAGLPAPRRVARDPRKLLAEISSCPGGASSIGAINATLLKAFFDETYVLPNPVQPAPTDPTRLIPYEGPPLTVGGELNKLATNLGQGRNWAGIHFRSDAAASLPQAEEVAIAILRDERATFREAFRGFELTRFDGTRVAF
jgi:hypothetical protein